MILDSSTVSSVRAGGAGGGTMGAASTFFGATFSSGGRETAGGATVAGSAGEIFPFAGAFFGAAGLTARGFFTGAASPSGLAVFLVDEVAMPGEGGGFRSWRLRGLPEPWCESPGLVQG